MAPRQRGVDGDSVAVFASVSAADGDFDRSRRRAGRTEAVGGPRGLPLIVSVVSVWIALDRFANGLLVGGPSGLCPLQQCWDSYYGELETFRIREDFHSQSASASDHSRSTTEWKRICSVYRSFSGCVQNASRDCVGNLNYHSTQRGVERKIAQYNCTFKDAGKRPDPEDGNKEREAEEGEEEEGEPAVGYDAARCSFQYHNVTSYRHCAMYGDPHLRTFEGAFQTCRIQGAWPLVDNDFLTVQITSASVGVGEGTSISEVTVVIKRNDSCALDRYVTYQAQNGDLPRTFDNGLIEFNTVEIFEISPKLHVEIDIGYKQTVVIIRLVGVAYSVSVNLPEDIYLEISEAHQGDGVVHLCHSGCPSSERVDLNSYFGQKSSKLKRTVIMSKIEAIERCRGLRLTGFYFDSCVYDLMATGDSSFASASYAAYSDLLRFVPDAATAVHRDDATLEKFDGTANSSTEFGKETFTLRITLFLIFLAHISIH